MKDFFITASKATALKYNGFFQSVFTCLILCWCSPVNAQSEFYEQWNFSGFGTLGYAQSDKYSDLILKRNITQRSQKIEDNGFLVDSRLGFQFSKEFFTHWDLVTQLVFKEKVNNNVENSLEMAFVRYQFNSKWSVRIGRMVLDTFLLSDYRNVGFSYHWVRPPTEFYGWIPYSHYDGVKGSFELGDFDNYLRVEAFAGKSDANVNVSYGRDGASYNHVRASTIMGMGITWEKGDLSLRAYSSKFMISDEIAAIEELKAIASTDVVQSNWPQAQQIAQDYGLKNSTYRYHSLGLLWEPRTWMVQGELSEVSASSFGTYGGQRGYVHVAHRFGPFLPHVSYSRSWDDTDYAYEPAPVAFEELEAQLMDNELSGVIKQYTISMGLRWDFASQKALKLQCDRTTLKEGSLGLFPTTVGVPRIIQETTRTWCSTTFDWLF